MLKSCQAWQEWAGGDNTSAARGATGSWGSVLSAPLLPELNISLTSDALCRRLNHLHFDALALSKPPRHQNFLSPPTTALPRATLGNLFLSIQPCLQQRAVFEWEKCIFIEKLWKNRSGAMGRIRGLGLSWPWEWYQPTPIHLQTPLCAVCGL